MKVEEIGFFEWQSRFQTESHRGEGSGMRYCVLLALPY